MFTKKPPVVSVENKEAFVLKLKESIAGVDKVVIGAGAGLSAAAGLNYLDFIDAKEEKILFLELGVGYNTPVIIRFPFEQLVASYKKAMLFRVNMSHPAVPKSLEGKGYGISMDIDELLQLLL